MLSPEGKMGRKTQNKRLSDDDDAAGEGPLCDEDSRDGHGSRPGGQR